MNKMWIVAKEVYRKNVKSWAFFWMIAGPIIMLGVVSLIIFFIARDTASSSVGNIAVITEVPGIEETITSLEDGNSYQFNLEESQAQEALLEDEIDGYLLVSGDVNSLAGTFYRNNEGKNINTSSMQEALTGFALQSKVQNLNLEPTVVNDLMSTQVTLETIRVQSQEGQVTEVSDSDPLVLARTGVAYGVSIIVFIFIMNYVSIVSQEIALEKGSRIMEIILSSISATHHFFGKLIGITLVILTQVAVYLLLAVIAYFVLQNLGESLPFELSQLRPLFMGSLPVIGYGAIYAIAGIAIYSILSAFLGSLVSKTEDVNKMVTPIIFLGLGGFYIAMYALNAPNSPLVRITSHIPLFTPFIMPFRIANESVSGLEIGLSIGIIILFLILTLWLSVVFYKSNVLVYSEKGLLGTFKQSLSIWRTERSIEK